MKKQEEEEGRKKPRIAIFSGANTTIANSPPLVTSNKARLPGEKLLPGRFDHLVPQLLYEPVTVKIKKFSAHPLESDAAELYQDDDGKDYYEVTLRPEDGLYALPYMARRRDGSPKGRPFEPGDLADPSMNYGGRQFFYPDASRIFEEIDRGIYGRDPNGVANIVDSRAEYDFIRVIPSGGYTKKGEVAGVDYFPYRPEAIAKVTRVRDLAKVANKVQHALSSGKYDGGIWFDGSPQLEETLYWLNLLVDTELPIVGVSAQRPHGQLSNDGDRNIVDAIDYINSGAGRGLGAVAVVDQRIYAARDVKKGDSRPGGYKSSGGHGGILGSVSSTGFRSHVNIWYRPAYKHTSSSEVNLSRLPTYLEFSDSLLGRNVKLQIKDEKDGTLRGESLPLIDIVKYSSYSQESEKEDESTEVAIRALIDRANADQHGDDRRPKLHGVVLEGSGGLAKGTRSQMKALALASMCGMPVVRVMRSDPEGKISANPTDLTIEGSNLDSNKARLLLIASMLKLGRLPRAKDPARPTTKEREAILEKIALFQKIFETH
ncbi:MAG TPA: asparaginase domain-containing protein [Nitrososphaerales archaeon]|nr:asparaginase domain-containing protein [Nitrososphaerales archaeon]